MCKTSGASPAIQLLILLCLFLGWHTPSYCQMSPGPLSKAHQNLEGPLSCAKCHAFGAGRAEFKCLDCHQEISRRLASHRGYHALQVKAGTKSNDCARCHSEHNGLEHQIVRWPSSREKFDHQQAGFRLEGKHAQLKCDECHNSKYLDPLDRAVLKRANPGASYAGLNSRCSACHRDVHAGQFPGSCLDCHSQSSWKNPPNFSHAKTKFVLTGKHAEVACADCHKPKDHTAGSPIQFKDFVNFQICTGCHKDPHANSFGANCERCHSTTSWKQMTTGTQFDHSRTRFPLLGKHADVNCQSCHKNDALQGLPQFSLCLNCHRDPHLGQFSEQVAGTDCKSCHDESSFAKSSYNVAQHSQTAYPLIGKHATVACSECHFKKGEQTQFKLTFAACTDCHKDAHEGQFAAAPYFNKCDSCHDLNGYQPSTFGAFQHDKTKFALSGAHAAVACSGCHTPNKEQTKFHLEGGQCIDCHKSPHGDPQATLTCEGCHKTASWQETLWFDHTNTKFLLTGRHTAVRCLSCHQPVTLAGVRIVPFATTSRQCESCHEDIHHGQFRSANADQVICAECHTANDWRPTQFDHNVHSDFKLDGAHADVPCRLCHDRQQIAGKLVITYKGTPRECSKCHK